MAGRYNDLTSEQNPADGWLPGVADDLVGVGPPVEDSAWAAAQNTDWHDDGGPEPDDPIWDEWAAEAEIREVAWRFPL